jgi:Glycosyl transferase family 11
MSTVILYSGGLGNQMFQFAAGYAHAKRNNGMLFADFSLMDKDILRNFELKKIFGIEPVVPNVLEKDEVYRKEINLKRFIGTRLYNKVTPYYKRAVINERNFEYDCNFEKFRSSAILNGYWQSEKYFKAFESEVKNAFSFSNKMSALDEQNTNLRNEIETTQSVSIHVRRKDYLNPNSAHHVCTVEYYNGALDLIRQRTKDKLKLFIFSDEIDWVSANLNLDLDATYVSHNIGDDSYMDMFLMSRCKHNIIANSSFSWWGAWLNMNDEKIVVAPKHWFKNASINTNDLIPQSWIRI